MNISIHFDDLELNAKSFLKLAAKTIQRELVAFSMIMSSCIQMSVLVFLNKICRLKFVDVDISMLPTL